MEAIVFLKNKIFYVNPMSYNELALYDLNIVNGIKGFEMFIFGNVLNKNYKRLNHSYFPIYNYSNKKGIIKIISYLLSLFILMYYIFKHKPKVIHIQWLKLYTFEYLLYCLIKKTLKTKLVFTSHNILPHDSGRKHVYIFGKWYKLVDVVIVHTKQSKKIICNQFNCSEKSVVVIPRGLVDLGKKSLPKRKSTKKLTFGFLGMLKKYKGVDVLIKAWSLLPKGAASLIIAGQGKVDIAPLVERNDVMIVNRLLTDDEFKKYLLECDVVLLPYQNISQSGLLFTCMNYSIPVVVSKLDGLLEPFQFGKVGWILNDCSEMSLYDAMLHLINNIKEVDDVKKCTNVWNAVHTYYSWNTTSELTNSVYCELS